MPDRIIGIVESVDSIVAVSGDEEVHTPVVETVELVVVAAGGVQGPAGTTSQLVSYEAGAALSGNRAVCLNDSGVLIYADSSTDAHKNKVLGITTGAVILGATGTVQTFGEMTEAGWSWTPGGAIYLSTTGALTQTAPSTGFILVVAYALTATKIFISVKQPIILT